MLLVLVLVVLVRNAAVESVRNTSSTSTTPFLAAAPLDDDYYWSYDYELSSNISDNLEMKSDSLILPNPETIASRYTLDILPNVHLPDDSLSDPDLKDHDFIDNLMYVYYGSHITKNNNSYGSEIIIIGSVLSCAAQLLTIFCVLLRKNLNCRRELKKLFLHLMACLCTSNLVFMLGVYATKNTTKCQVIALILHYLHLLSALWIFLYSFYISKIFSEDNNKILQFIYLLAYGIPILLTLLCFGVAPKSYETRKFCFISVQKGMLFNYMFPIAVLIILTTINSLNGIRRINLELSKLEMNSSIESLNILRNNEDVSDERKQDEQIISLKECKSALKVLCLVQSSFDVVWFTAVLALENVDYSSSMPIFYTIFSSILNWFIFVKTKAFLPSTISEPKKQLVIDDARKEIKITTDPVSISRRSSCDNIPLLINMENCTEMHELRQETISTISN